MDSIRRALLRCLAFFRSTRAEADLSREIDAHLRLLEDDFAARGMSGEDARYAARRAFGGVEQVKERQRDARSFRWLDSSWLDLKLGLRLLVKYPGLTLVGGLAMAFAIAVGAASFQFLNQLVYPTLPLHEGHRIVEIRLWHTAANGVEEQALHDFVSWRGRLRTIAHLGAFRTIERNLITGDTYGEALMAAEISASAFDVARVPALLGRPLVEADEQQGAPPVVVIGYDVWQTRFAGDRDVIGRVVQVGTVKSTVVGVMPDGFEFPVFHSLWLPLRVSDLTYAPRRGPWITIFGRLAPDVRLEEAQAELTTLGLRAAAEFPDTHEHIRPEIVPYGQSASSILVELGPVVLMSINLFFIGLLVLVCANVALLMFARAAAREAEIAVRSALGASRGRIIGQLFAEALTLGVVAAGAGLAAAGAALRWWLSVSRIENAGLLPFWMDDSLAPATVVYAGGLTVLGALIAGVMPALKMTGRKVESRLRQATAGGGGLRFGGIWTAVIVAQVAVTVGFPATAWFLRREVVRVRSVDPGFPSEQYLSAELEMDPDFPPASSSADIRAVFPAARFRAASEELKRRLTAEPGVVGVTFTDRLPRTHHTRRRIEVDGIARAAQAPDRAAIILVDLDYFDVLGAAVVAGHAFRRVETDSNAIVGIVNQSFVRHVLGGRNALGLRVRVLPDGPDDAGPGPWLEIIGVVPNLGTIAGEARQSPALYRPVTPGSVRPSYVVVHASAAPESFAPRLHAIAAAVDPTLRLQQVVALSEVDRTLWLESDFLFKLLILVSAIALLLSLAGIYSVLSFTVAQRTREIGIRLALGADRRRIVRAIFGRPLARVGLGVVAGMGLTTALAVAVDGRISAWGSALIALYGAVMMAVCLIGCIVPTRRALGVDPTEALRTDG